jgi:hypothetical protein
MELRNCVLVNAANLADIAERVLKSGWLVVAHPWFINYELFIELLEKPRIDVETKMFHMRRNTTLERHYRLKKRALESRMDALFESATSEHYLFFIARQSMSSCGFPTDCVMLYVREREDIAEALRVALNNPPRTLEKPLSKEEIEHFLAYAIEDLQSGAMVKKNTAAGVQADEILGIG